MSATFPRWGRIALCVAFAALWAWFDVVVPLRHLPQTGGDFRAYHQAARALAAGESPYSESAFIYPPLLPMVLLPLASMPLENARLVWFAASQIALLLSLWLTWRVLGGGTVALASVLLAWTVGGTVQENLVLGQLNPFLLLGLALVMHWVSGRPTRSAAVIGIAAALKVWPALLLLVFAWRRAWRPLAAGIGVTLALTVVPAAITAMLVEEPDALGGARPLRIGSAAPLNVSLPAMALRLADPPRGEELPASWTLGTAPEGFEPWQRHGWIAATVAALVLALAALALARSHRVRSSAALELGAMTAAAVLAAPVGWYHYQLCQLPAFALLLDRRLRERRPRRFLLVLLLLAALTRLPAWGFGVYVERWGFTARAPAALWLATSLGPGLALLSVALLIREARRSAPDPTGAEAVAEDGAMSA